VALKIFDGSEYDIRVPVVIVVVLSPLAIKFYVRVFVVAFVEHLIKIDLAIERQLGILVCIENLNTGVVVMKSAQDGA
jgi:hypothetical protein